MNQRVIFIAVNRKFFPHTMIFLGSLLRNYPSYPEILVFYTDLGPREIERLLKYPRVRLFHCELDPDQVGPPMVTLNLNYMDPHITYLRFRIWTDVLSGYDKILHLDTDILVLGSLDELFEGNEFKIFAESYQGDCSVFYDHGQKDLLDLLKEDGLVLPKNVANFGVFMAPLKDRTGEDRDMLFRLLRRYDKFIKWADQSVINLWLAKKGIPVSRDNRFNFQHRLIDQHRDWPEVMDARLFHFNGVDNVYRLFLMRCADKLFGTSYGYRVYVAIYKTARFLLSTARKLKPKPRR